FKNGTIYCANAGDSRAILSSDGNVFELSYDHKPNNDIEMQRINKAGGYVEFNRVNGNLALSRALGDFTYKTNETILAEDQIVTANPDLIVKQLEPGDEFIVLACDGIWDCMTNQEVLEFVRKRLAKNMEPYVICEELMDACLATEVRPGGVGCDNMSVIIACLLRESSFKEFCANIH
ncbi:PP2C family serine/threonine-protein phosphatase, partial [Salmonella sp. s51228]|uniref:PP2C family serine/threonine-protein phosphatase n=1 Tax=Salmonella sp. s51228 TaxID=3159652 RepID=UPI00397F81FD